MSVLCGVESNEDTIHKTRLVASTVDIVESDGSSALTEGSIVETKSNCRYKTKKPLLNIICYTA